MGIIRKEDSQCDEYIIAPADLTDGEKNYIQSCGGLIEYYALYVKVHTDNDTVKDYIGLLWAIRKR